MCVVGSTTSLRERKRADTRTRIEREALRLFLRRGYDAVTVADIAAAADVAPRTFFRYYPAKDDVLFARDAEIAELISSLLSERPLEEDPMLTLRTCCEAMVDWTVAQEKLVRDRYAVVAASGTLSSRDAAKRSAIDAGVAAMLRERLGADAQDPRPLLYSRIASACYDAALQAWLSGGGSLHEALARAFAALPPGPVAG